MTVQRRPTGAPRRLRPAMRRRPTRSSASAAGGRPGRAPLAPRRTPRRAGSRSCSPSSRAPRRTARCAHRRRRTRWGEAGRARVSWYGDGGERIELSGAVLENWVSKTANLLVEEFDAGPGVRVLVDLPPHWRTIVWAFAAWRVGACVVLPSDASAPSSGVDVVVSDRPDRFGR